MEESRSAVHHATDPQVRRDALLYPRSGRIYYRGRTEHRPHIRLTPNCAKPISRHRPFMIGELGLSERESDLKRRHAWGAKNYGIHADNCAVAHTSDLILFIQHIPHVGGYVDP